MTDSEEARGLAGRFLAWISSAPLLVKIVGAGALVAAIFGGVILVQVHRTLFRALSSELRDRAQSQAELLAHNLERPLATGDLYAVRRTLARTMRAHPEMRYILVEDEAGRIRVHTFESEIPPDLVGLRSAEDRGTRAVKVFASEEGRIFEAAVPLLDGEAGRVRLGMVDEMVSAELSASRWSMLLMLGLCMAVGLGLALLLVYILTRPARDLLLATNQVGEGRFEARARVYGNDEFGRLARAFNRMAERLEGFRREVLDKEAARLALVERTVQIQEMERQSIAKDLHDHLGSSLSLVLLEIRSLASDGGPEGRCAALERQVSDLIDEVHRLARGMHPSILDDYGLDQALERYIAEISRNGGIEIDYQRVCPPGLGRLPMRAETALYRIGQEAIRNVVRHARARHASVILLRSPEETLLLVEDDGVGFDPEGVRRDGTAHLGLIGMRERTVLLGGEFTVESTPGRGTTVRARIPQGRGLPCPSGS